MSVKKYDKLGNLGIRLVIYARILLNVWLFVAKQHFPLLGKRHYQIKSRHKRHHLFLNFQIHNYQVNISQSNPFYSLEKISVVKSRSKLHNSTAKGLY